nr:helix-turn-helix domain-containing protein [Micromonospora sp. DSM 115978]
MTRPVDDPLALTQPKAPPASTDPTPSTDPPASTADQPPRPRRRGRPLEDDIRATVVDLLAEHGFAALTMDLVAARARAGKATLYRRWSGKLDLVADAVAQLGAAPATDPDTGSLRGDVLAQLRELARSLTG